MSDRCLNNLMNLVVGNGRVVTYSIMCPAMLDRFFKTSCHNEYHVMLLYTYN